MSDSTSLPPGRWGSGPPHLGEVPPPSDPLGPPHLPGRRLTSITPQTHQALSTVSRSMVCWFRGPVHRPLSPTVSPVPSDCLTRPTHRHLSWRPLVSVGQLMGPSLPLRFGHHQVGTAPLCELIAAHGAFLTKPSFSALSPSTSPRSLQAFFF